VWCVGQSFAVFLCVQWWEDLPSHPNLTFIRGLQPYQGEDPRGIDHTRLPAQDGPRGVGWMSGYVSGGLQQALQADLDVLPGATSWLMLGLIGQSAQQGADIAILQFAWGAACNLGQHA